MKLALTVSTLQGGGTERVVSHLANGFAAKGYAVHVITYSSPEESLFFPMDSKVIRHPLDLFGGGSVLFGPFRRLKRWREMRKTFREIRPEAVLSFGDKTNVMAVLAGLGLKIPIIVSERANPEKQAETNGAFWSLVIALAYRLAHRVIFQTSGAAQYFIDRGVRSGTIIPNPVAQPASPSHEAPDRGRQTTILGVGRFTREKGFDLLIEAFARIAGQHPEWRLVIHGDGPLRPELEHRVSQGPVPDRVFLPGTTTDLAQAFSEAGLFVLPSRHEGFPNALCEAMAHGLPVIATDCPFGPRDIIEHGIDGWLVPNEDPVAMSEAMTKLIADSGLRAALGRKASGLAQRLAMDSVLTQWESVLREEVNQP